PSLNPWAETVHSDRHTTCTGSSRASTARRCPMAEPRQLGRYFEDFTVGDVYRHPLGRTISEADNTWFTLLTMNTNQYHFNAHYAKGSPLTGGRMLVNSALTVAVVLGLSV